MFMPGSHLAGFPDKKIIDHSNAEIYGTFLAMPFLPMGLNGNPVIFRGGDRGGESEFLLCCLAMPGSSVQRAGRLNASLLVQMSTGCFERSGGSL